MARRLLTAAALLLAVPAAAEDTTSEVCTFTATETRTAPKKPNIMETVLDCGEEPSEQQTYLAGMVNNAMNIPTALELMVRDGYEVEGQSVRDSYTGRQIISVFTLVKEADEAPEAETTMDDDPFALPEASADDLSDMPEAGDEMSEDEADASDFEDSEDDVELDF